MYTPILPNIINMLLTFLSPEWQPGAAGSDNGPSYKWDNAPDSDPDEDGDSDDDGAPAKPEGTFDPIQGYESVAFGDG